MAIKIFYIIYKFAYDYEVRKLWKAIKILNVKFA